MTEKSSRASIVAGLCVLIPFVVGARAARAQTDGGAPGAPSVTGTPDGGAPPAEAPAAPPGESGGGLFEQSQAAAAPAAGETTLVGKAPFTLNGYARGDVFIGKVDGQNAAE